MALDWEPKTLKKELEERGVDGDLTGLPEPIHPRLSPDSPLYYTCPGVGINKCDRVVVARTLVDVTALVDVDADYVCDGCVATLMRDTKTHGAARYGIEDFLTGVGAPTDFIEDFAQRKANAAAANPEIPQDMGKPKTRL